MATPGPSGDGKLPRRLTAEQAMEMFHNISIDSDEDLDQSHDSDSSVVSNDFSSSSSSEEDEPQTRTRAIPLLQSCMATSKGKGKKRKMTTDETIVGNKEVEESEWIQANIGDQTTNNFIFSPHKEPGFNKDILSENCSPLDCFIQLFDDEVIDIVISCINSYAEKKMKQNTPLRRRSRFQNWKPVSKYHIYKFIAISLAMGMNKRPSLQDYFSTTDIFISPFYSELFSRDNFLILYSSMLHCGHPDAEGKSKIEPYINKLLQKFNLAFTPYQNVSIDEMIVGFKGRWQYKQYNPSKPYKYHIKSFGLVDSATGYVVNLLTYYGKNTFDPDADVNGGQAVQIFQTLLHAIGKGYHVFADRFYTTMNLVEYLTEKEIYYTGTFQGNRRRFPKQLNSLKIKHMESKYWKTPEGQKMVVAWKDKKAKKPVLLVSTRAEAGDILVKNKTKPSAINSYNQYMNGCDLADQKVGYYGMQNRKTSKWWKKLYHWIMEIACSNAHILYVLSHPEARMSLKKFKIQLIDSLCLEALSIMPAEEKARKMPLPGRPRANPIPRLEGGRHLIDYAKQDRRCRVCSTSTKPARTHFICMDCPEQPHLHPKDCFKKWHTVAKL